MQVIPFVPPSSEAAENIAAFVMHWRPMVEKFPNVESFDSDNWDLREAGSIRSIAHGDKRLGLPFTKLNLENQRLEGRPLDQPLRDIAKAFTIQLLAENSYSSHTVYLRWVQLWRFVEVGLLQRGLTASPEFLTPDILDEVNLTIRMSRLENEFPYDLCLRLNSLVKKLQALGHIRTHFSWAGVAVAPDHSFRRVGSEHDRVRKEKLLTEREIQAVGEVFHKAKLDRHRYPMAMAAILSGQPGRIGEVLILPINCAFDETRNGKKLFRLRWWPEKGGMPMTKDFSYATNPWIPHFKTALAWLLEIGEPARKIARWYEDNLGKIHLPGHLEYLRAQEWLSLEEAAAILQVSPNKKALHERLGHRKIPVHGERSTQNRTVRFEDVEQAVLAELPKGFPVYYKPSGLKYSEALCLVRNREFGDPRRCDDGPSHTMFYRPSQYFVNSLLNGAFTDFGLTDEDGEPIRIRTHGFRHRWCTRAEEAGIWRSFNNAMSGRLKISQANGYDHMTADYLLKVRSENVKDDGRLFGEILTFTPKDPLYLNEVERQIEELAMLKAIVVTPFGICINDFVQSPCEYLLDCLNCRNHACIKGLPVRTENIRNRLALQEKALNLARLAMKNGDYGVEYHIKSTLEPNVQRLRAIVTILDDPRFKFGTEIILADGPSNHPITKALQIRINALKEQGLDTSTEETMLLPTRESLELRLPADL